MATSSKAQSGLRQDKYFVLLLGIIFFLILVFGGLQIYNTQLTGRISTLQEEMEEIDQERDQGLEKEMTERLPALQKIGPVARNHTNLKNIFDFLEKKILADVKITSLNFDSKDHILQVSTQSENERRLAMQAYVFSSAPRITKVEVINITKVGGGTPEEIFMFDFKLTLDKEVTSFFTKINK